jgi:hypothetical protein
MAVREERAMEIIKLPVGKQASVDADCIRIEEQPSGNYRLTATALCAAADEGESVSIVGDGLEFETVEQAEATGVARAAEVGVEQLFVSTGTCANPLEPIDIDEPL